MTTGLHLTKAGQATCPTTGKAMYRSPHAADRRRRHIKRRRNDRQSVYRCGHCRYWHLGHSTKDAA